MIFFLFQSIQESRLDLIPGNKCKTVTKDVGFLPRTELCAGKKYIQRIDTYTYNHQDKLFKRVQHKNQVNDTQIKYGKIDSCVGDSGGPLWKWMGESNPKAKVPYLLFLKCIGLKLQTSE